MKHERHGTYHYCIQCDYFARKSNTLSMHYALKHSDYSPHQCKSCPKSFKTKSQLNHHVLSNHTDSMIQCKHPMCNESFKSQVNYRIHWIRAEFRRIRRIGGIGFAIILALGLYQFSVFALQF